MSTTYVSAKFRITIPRKIREMQNIKVGDRVSFLKKGDEIAIIKVPDNPLTKMRGLLSTDKKIRGELERIKEEDRDSEEKRGL